MIKIFHFINKKTKLCQFQSIKKLNASKTDTVKLQMKLIDKLDQFSPRVSALKVDQVIIENQPVKRNAKMKEVLTSLYGYMKTHFKHEEKFMQEINYPLFEEHKELHHNIIEKINTFVKKLPTMDENIFEKELAKIIDIALVHHIIQEDRKITAWAKSNPKI